LGKEGKRREAKKEEKAEEEKEKREMTLCIQATISLELGLFMILTPFFYAYY